MQSIFRDLITAVQNAAADENDMDWEDELPLEDEWDEGDAWAEWLEVEEDGFSESSEEDGQLFHRNSTCC